MPIKRVVPNVRTESHRGGRYEPRRLYIDSLVIILWCHNKMVVLQFAKKPMAQFENHLGTMRATHAFSSLTSLMPWRGAPKHQLEQVKAGLGSCEGSLLVPLPRGAG